MHGLHNHPNRQRGRFVMTDRDWHVCHRYRVNHRQHYLYDDDDVYGDVDS